MKRNYAFIFAAALLTITGCTSTYDNDMTLSNEANENETRGWVNFQVTGPTTIRMGNSATFNMSFDGEYSVRWGVYIKESSGEYTEQSDNIIELSTTSNLQYKIVVLKQPGTYFVKGELLNNTGKVVASSYKQFDVPKEMTLGGINTQILTYFACRNSANRIITYQQFALVNTIISNKCCFRTFNVLPLSSHPLYDYLIPVYQNSVINGNYYTTTGSGQVAFFIFDRQLPGTVPLYQFQEQYTAFNTNGQLQIVVDNKFFSTTSSTSHVNSNYNVYNRGLVGYVFP